MRIYCLMLLAFLSFNVKAQFKTYSLNTNGDTINAVNKEGQKTGKWVYRVEELRGNPGYEEEGVYVKGQKNGFWRKYNLDGDLIAVEHYKMGGKDGLQQYYTFLGNLEREENWRGYNPDSPYDTIPVYGSGSNEILEMKIVKAEPYSVKHGPWKYYDDQGRLMRVEEWDRNNIVKPKEVATASKEIKDKPKKPEKTAEMMQWELKNKGKKKVVRDGRTGL